jgi:GNAT superfamily N-acetyltransferase
MRPAHIAAFLRASGFDDGGEEPAMAADLRIEPPSAPTAVPMTIHAVRDDAGLDAYRRTLGDGFGEGPKEADWVASVFGAIGLGDETPWRHWVGVLDDEPVCTASVFLTPPVAGVYFVSTRPDFRRRGLGMAVTRHAMLAAAALGATTAVLGSSPMGQRVYERLGFEAVFRYRLLEWEPEQ